MKLGCPRITSPQKGQLEIRKLQNTFYFSLNFVLNLITHKINNAIHFCVINCK